MWRIEISRPNHRTLDLWIASIYIWIFRRCSWTSSWWWLWPRVSGYFAILLIFRLYTIFSQILLAILTFNLTILIIRLRIRPTNITLLQNTVSYCRWSNFFLLWLFLYNRRSIWQWLCFINLIFALLYLRIFHCRIKKSCLNLIVFSLIHYLVDVDIKSLEHPFLIFFEFRLNLFALHCYLSTLFTLNLSYCCNFILQCLIL